MADGMGVELTGVTEFSAAIDRLILRANAAAIEAVTTGAALIERNAKSNFEGNHKKGQPHVGGSKPNVVTGTLRRSIHSEPVEQLSVGRYQAKVGPSVIYGRRIELGFRGSDSLGRNYRQPPYPYFGPAVEAAQPLLDGIFTRAWARALGA